MQLYLYELMQNYQNFYHLNNHFVFVMNCFCDYNPHKNIKLHDFINEVEKSGKLIASDYNWPTNNCKHFTAKLINLLQATRNVHNNDDWIELPKPVLQSLKSNEQE